jgi:Lon protease-like protein
MNILTVGEQRFRLRGATRALPEGYLVGDVELLVDRTTAEVDAALVASVGDEFGKYEAAVLAMTSGAETAKPPALPADPTRLSYRVGATLHIHHRERQQLLEMEDVGERLRHELRLLRRENRPAAKMMGPFSMN